MNTEKLFSFLSFGLLRNVVNSVEASVFLAQVFDRFKVEAEGNPNPEWMTYLSERCFIFNVELFKIKENNCNCR